MTANIIHELGVIQTFPVSAFDKRSIDKSPPQLVLLHGQREVNSSLFNLLSPILSTPFPIFKCYSGS
jgi:hypothetical protein